MFLRFLDSTESEGLYRWCGMADMELEVRTVRSKISFERYRYPVLC